MKVERSKSIPAAQATLWRIITHFDLLSRWTGVLDHFELEGTPGPGSRFREVHRFLGRRAYEGYFTEWKEHHRWTGTSYPQHGSGIPIPHTVTYQLYRHRGEVMLTISLRYTTQWGTLVETALSPVAYYRVHRLLQKIKKEAIVVEESKRLLES